MTRNTFRVRNTLRVGNTLRARGARGGQGGFGSGAGGGGRGALRARSALVAPALVGVLVLAGCSDDGSDGGSGGGSGKDTTQGSARDNAGSGTDAAQQRGERALEHSRCMRENGVPKFPDPAPGGGVQISPDDGIDPESSAFKKAQEACRSLAPQGQGPGGKLDPQKVAAWAACLRENGLPDFADPRIDGGTMELDFNGSGISPRDDAFQKARKACQDKWPGGGLKVTGGGQ